MKIKMLLVFTLALSVFQSLCAQENMKRSSNFHLGLDLQTKYVWRGMEMITQDASPVVFPQLNYQDKGFYAYVMGGYAINGKYIKSNFNGFSSIILNFFHLKLIFSILYHQK